MRIRKLLSKDADGMLEWMHDSDINWVFATDFSNYTKKKVLDFIEKQEEPSQEIHYACVDDTDNYLGTVSLKNIDREALHAEYAISFCKKAHGTGAASFATQEILRIAFDEQQLNRVYLYVMSDNARANRFYQKSGFVLEGCLRQHLFVRNKLHDVNWYGMLRFEWSNNR